MSGADVAEITLDAVAKKQFYIFPHGKIKALVKARAEAASEEQAAFDSRLPLTLALNA